MQTINTQFEAEARKLIKARMEELSDNLALGRVMDFTAYKHETGKIAGLRLALEQFDQVNTILSKR